MQLLIDTHVFLWAADAPEMISNDVRDAIEDASKDVFVSTIAACEIAIKFGRAPLSLTHALAISGLPAIHADPFDRMMIAQTIIERMTLVTRDARMLRYPVKTLPA